MRRSKKKKEKELKQNICQRMRNLKHSPHFLKKKKRKEKKYTFSNKRNL